MPKKKREKKNLNQLGIEVRKRMIACLVEGMSLRATERLCDVSKNSVAKLIRDVGMACALVHHELVRKLPSTQIQADELTSFIQQKKKKLYTWIAIDAQRKLLIAWHSGGRTKADANQFLVDVRERVGKGVRISTDAYAAYQPGIAEVFGCNARHSIFKDGVAGLYSRGTRQESTHTSFVERMNLTIRMGNKRFARRSNAFSKTIAYHDWMLCIQIAHYNFCRVHRSLRVTPAMESGLTNRVWGIDELIYWPNAVPKKAEVVRLPTRQKFIPLLVKAA